MDQTKERSAVGIDRELDKDECYNVTVNPVIVTEIGEGSPFPSLKLHLSDPSGKEVTLFIRGLRKGGLSHLVSADSPIRAIALKDHPNILYLQFVHYFALHCLNSSPKKQKKRGKRANELNNEGITRQNLYETIEFLIDWMSNHAPAQVTWSDRGTDCIFLLAISLNLRKQVLNVKGDTTFNLKNIWQKFVHNMTTIKEDLLAQFTDRPKKYKIKLNIWKLVVTRVKTNFLDFESLFDPTIYLIETLIPELEQLFNIRDIDGNLVEKPSIKEQEELDNLIKRISERAEKIKVDMIHLYPKYFEIWKLIKENYIECKNDLDLARKEADNFVLQREQEFQRNYGKKLPEEDKKNLKQSIEERLISGLK